jgi:serine/threonine protein kinase
VVYFPPEIRGKPAGTVHSPEKADIWMLGVILFCLTMVPRIFELRDYYKLDGNPIPDLGNAHEPDYWMFPSISFASHMSKTLQVRNTRRPPPASLRKPNGDLFATLAEGLEARTRNQPDSDALVDLLNRMLRENPYERPTVVSISNHPWVLCVPLDLFGSVQAISSTLPIARIASVESTTSVASGTSTSDTSPRSPGSPDAAADVSALHFSEEAFEERLKEELVAVLSAEFPDLQLAPSRWNAIIDIVRGPSGI